MKKPAQLARRSVPHVSWTEAVDQCDQLRRCQRRRYPLPIQLRGCLETCSSGVVQGGCFPGSEAEGTRRRGNPSRKVVADPDQGRLFPAKQQRPVRMPHPISVEHQRWSSSHQPSAKNDDHRHRKVEPTLEPVHRPMEHQHHKGRQRHDQQRKQRRSRPPTKRRWEADGLGGAAHASPMRRASASMQQRLARHGQTAESVPRASPSTSSACVPHQQRPEQWLCVRPARGRPLNVLRTRVGH